MERVEHRPGVSDGAFAAGDAVRAQSRHELHGRSDRSEIGIPRLDDRDPPLVDSEEPAAGDPRRVRGVHLFKTRKDDTIRILSKFLGTKDPEGLLESWEYAAKMPAKPYAVDSAVQAVLDHLAESQPKYGQYKPAEFVDARVLSEIDKSGYIDKLYGGSGR